MTRPLVSVAIRMKRRRYLKLWLAGLLGLGFGFYAIQYRNEVKREKYLRAGMDIAELQTDLEQFQMETGRYPTTREGLRTLFGGVGEDPGFVRGIVEPHQSLKSDPWGRQYFYQSDGEHYVLGSFGALKRIDPDPSLLVHSN
jgi:general secretion pathway protein G